MRFISTRAEVGDHSAYTSASDAIMRGLAPDGGLYVPESFPPLSARVLEGGLSYVETAIEVLTPFFEGDVLAPYLPGLCSDAFNFPVPLHWHTDEQAVLELFHGPTAAFKDFGARFLAASMERLLQLSHRRLTILVATSGDTGGAVAAAFHGRSGIDVKVLFPKGRVSARQERQLTCWDENIESFAVRGAFDDCQHMVKKAFMDKGLSERYGLSSANSINLGRLLPQMVYYVQSSIEYVRRTGKRPVFIIPSGNVGNSAGAYWACQMGAPIERVILAVNANRTIPDFLDSGVYAPRESIATLANAMDVGNPSNMERLVHLFGGIDGLREHLTAYSIDDVRILTAIGDVWRDTGYAVCPHTAAGEAVRADHCAADDPTIVVSTAHPAKFETIVEPVIGKTLEIPKDLADLLHREVRVKEIGADIELVCP